MRLLDAVSYFKAEWISINPIRCLNPRHRMDFCDDCVKGCPQKAIKADLEDVVIDPELCNNCGICVADCPTGVFGHDYFDGLSLVSWAKEKAAIDLHCQMSGEAELSDDQARIPCHGMLDSPLLLALKGVGVEKLHLHGLKQCADCPTRVGEQRIRERIEEHEETCSWPEIQIDEADPGEDERERVQTQDSEARQAEVTRIHAEPTASRRDFFKQIARKGAESVASSSFASLIEQEEKQKYSDNIGVDDAALMTKYVPAKHRLILTALVAGNERGMEEQLHKITASDACTGCQVCATRCPTGALSWQDDGDSVALNYRTAACIGCSLCVSLCPYEALTLTRQEDHESVLQDEVKQLFASQQLRCEQCGDRFLPHDGDNRYCWICKNEMEMDDQWLSFLKTPGAE